MRKIVFLLLIIISTAASARELELPVPPDTMRVPARRAAYIMEHFWDSLGPADTVAVRDAEFMEQNLANFFSLAPHAAQPDMERAVRSFVARVAPDGEAAELVWRLSEKYLSEPASPVFSEDVFYIVAKAMRDMCAPGSSQCDYIDYRLALMEKNRPGTRAADFDFIDRSGARHSFLESLRPDAETMLVFFDPDCDDCHALAAKLEAEGTGGRDVVMITPHEVDMRLWQQYASTLPQDWTVGYSPGGLVDADELYYVPQFPTVCLIGPGAIVVDRPF